MATPKIRGVEQATPSGELVFTQTQSVPVPGAGGSSFGNALPRLPQHGGGKGGMGWASLLGDRKFAEELVASETWDFKEARNHGILDDPDQLSQSSTGELLGLLANQA